MRVKKKPVCFESIISYCMTSKLTAVWPIYTYQSITPELHEHSRLLFILYLSNIAFSNSWHFSHSSKCSAYSLQVALAISPIQISVIICCCFFYDMLCIFSNENKARTSSIQVCVRRMLLAMQVQFYWLLIPRECTLSIDKGITQLQCILPSLCVRLLVEYVLA